MVEGCGQLPGVDCSCTYAPVRRIQSIHMALTCCRCERKVRRTSAGCQRGFLNTNLQEKVYVKQQSSRLQYESLEAATRIRQVMKLKKCLRTLLKPSQPVLHYRRLHPCFELHRKVIYFASSSRHDRDGKGFVTPVNHCCRWPCFAFFRWQYLLIVMCVALLAWCVQSLVSS